MNSSHELYCAENCTRTIQSKAHLLTEFKAFLRRSNPFAIKKKLLHVVGLTKANFGCTASALTFQLIRLIQEFEAPSALGE